MRDSTTTQLPIVVGIDGSQAAIQAAEWAVDEAVSREVPLRLVEVIAEQVEPAPFASVGNVRMEVEYAETALRIAAAAVAAAGKPVKVETAILQGDPAAALIAESRNAEMVCVGSVGIGRFARALLGSTVAELAEAATCPVAIIRTQQHRPKPDSCFDRGRGQRFTRQRRRCRAGDDRGPAASRTGPCSRGVATRPR